MKAAIFANGSNKIGMGHIIRTMAIAETLKSKNIEIEYICNSSSSECTEFIRSKNYKTSVKFSHEDKYAFIIVDSYDINSSEKLSYFYKFAKHVIYIDDLHLLYDYNIDIIINYSVGAEILHYNGAKIKQLGPKFTPLRKQFLNVFFEESNKSVENILITMGAGDEFNYTQYILENLLNLYPNLNYKVILGMTNVYKERLVDGFKNKKVQFYSNVSNMANLMKSCDIAISAGGSTIYELCACSVPTIAVITAMNQKQFIKNIHEKINLQYVDFTSNKNIEFISEFNKLYENHDFRKLISCKMNSLIDGNGTKRIAEAILNLK